MLDSDKRCMAIGAALLANLPPAERRVLDATIRTLPRSSDPRRRSAERDLAKALAPVARATADDAILEGALRVLFPALAAADWEMMMKLARWGAAGLPAVRVSNTQAAALMLSDLSPEQLAEVRAPFRAFDILIEPPFPVEGHELPLGRAEVFVWDCAERVTEGVPFKDRWVVLLRTGPLARLWRGRLTPEELYATGDLFEPPSPDAVAGAVSPTVGVLTPHDERVMALVVRLVLNVVLALSEQRAAAPASEPVRAHSRRKKHGAGSVQIVLELPVNVDMRGHIADYLSGEAKRVYKVRWVVRGHWRNQPFGPGRAQRKLIWIAPHWKGPEAASAAPDDG